jgi:hypothetical protein
MENQNKLIIIIMIIFVLFTSSVIISQSNNNHNNVQKTLMNESIYKYNTVNILKLNIGNKTIYLYDNNFTVISNPSIIHILNSSVQPLFTVQNYVNTHHYFCFDMTIRSNIPIKNLPFYQSGTSYLVCGIINYFNNNNKHSVKILSEFYSTTGITTAGTSNQLNFTALSMQNQYIFYYSGSTLKSIYFNNFIYSNNFYASIVNRTFLTDTVIFGQKNQYIVNFHTYYNGKLTITNSTTSTTYNNIINNFSVLLNNGSYSFKFIYVKNNKTYYNNGSFNVYGNNSLDIILSTNTAIPFSYSFIFFLILLIITSLIIMFYIKNYWLLLINILIILAIGISENIHIISFAYVLLIALFLSMYIAYKVSLKGDFE